MLHSLFRVFAVLACFLAAGCSKEGPKAPESRRATHLDEVRAVLAAQQAAWNRQDLDGFLAGYRKDEHVVFTTREGSSRGFSELEQRYRKSYNSPEKFGELAFTDIAYRNVDADSVLVEGSWRLVRAEDSPHGRFVLIVCRFPEGWKIVTDFTTEDATGG